MRCLVLVGLLAACKFDPQGGSGATPADGPDTGEPPIDAPRTDCTSFSKYVDTCATTPGPALQLSGTLHYDTMTGALVAGTGAVVAVTSQTLMSPTGEVEAIVAAGVT